MLDWQPIATVPKDGTKVLCWRNGEIAAARWIEKWDGCECLGGNGWSYPSWDQPTHWAPMPPGPHDTAMIPGDREVLML